MRSEKQTGGGHGQNRFASESRRVLLWLGPEQDHSDKAFSLLESLSSEVQTDSTTMQMHPLRQCTSVARVDPNCILPFTASELTLVSFL
jgi:hypothetical protein